MKLNDKPISKRMALILLAVMPCLRVYLARYAFDEVRDLVGVARIWHQKESGDAAEAC